jgi:hypothetical protein
MAPPMSALYPITHWYPTVCTLFYSTLVPLCLDR